MSADKTHTKHTRGQKLRERGLSMLELLAALVVGGVVASAAVATLNTVGKTSSTEIATTDVKSSLRRMTDALSAQTAGRSFLAIERLTTNGTEPTSKSNANIVFIDAARSMVVMSGAGSTSLTVDRNRLKPTENKAILINGKGDAVRVTILGASGNTLSIQPELGLGCTVARLPELDGSTRLYPAGSFSINFDSTKNIVQQSIDGASSVDAAYNIESFTLEAAYDGPRGMTHIQGNGNAIPNVRYETVSGNEERQVISGLQLTAQGKRGLASRSYAATLPLNLGADVGLKNFMKCNGPTQSTEDKILGGAMNVRVSGIPEDSEAYNLAKYDVSGPTENGKITSAMTWNQTNEAFSKGKQNLIPGVYNVTLKEVRDTEFGGSVRRIWQPRGSGESVTVTSWNSPVVEAAYKIVPGSLSIVINNPSTTTSTEINLTVQGPVGSDSFAPKSYFDIKESQTLSNLAPGRYIINAPSFGECGSYSDSGCLEPSQATYDVFVSSRETANASVGYTHVDPPPPPQAVCGNERATNYGSAGGCRFMADPLGDDKEPRDLPVAGVSNVGCNGPALRCMNPLGELGIKTGLTLEIEGRRVELPPGTRSDMIVDVIDGKNVTLAEYLQNNNPVEGNVQEAWIERIPARDPVTGEMILDGDGNPIVALEMGTEYDISSRCENDAESCNGITNVEPIITDPKNAKDPIPKDTVDPAPITSTACTTAS